MAVGLYKFLSVGLVDYLLERGHPHCVFIVNSIREIPGCSSHHYLISAFDLLGRVVRGVVMGLGGWERGRDVRCGMG
jgi:hypothetical protein